MNDTPDILDIKILDYCGSGAYGDVWIGIDHSGIKRAVKVLNKRRLENIGVLYKEEKAIKLFRKNIKRHPNLVEIFYVGETEEILYYIMELADNAEIEKYIPTTLDYFIKEKALSTEKCIEFCSHILEGLNALHNADLVHRDIKPSNIIFVNDILKLADIGLIAYETTSISFTGTEYFFPPERSIGKKADLYAVGKVLYCMFTGLSPDKFPSLPDNIISDMNEKKRHINKIINKACSKSQKNRFNSSDEFLMALNGEIKNFTLPPLKKIIGISIVVITTFMSIFYYKSKDVDMKLTKENRIIFAKHLLLYKKYYLRKQYDKAIEEINLIEEKFPLYTKNGKMEKYKVFIKNGIKKQVLKLNKLNGLNDIIKEDDKKEYFKYILQADAYLDRNEFKSAIEIYDKIENRWPMYKTKGFGKINKDKVLAKKEKFLKNLQP